MSPLNSICFSLQSSATEFLLVWITVRELNSYFNYSQRAQSNLQKHIKDIQYLIAKFQNYDWIYLIEILTSDNSIRELSS